MLKKLLIVSLILFSSTLYANDEIEAGKVIFENICSDCHYEDDFAGETKEHIYIYVTDIKENETKHKITFCNLSNEDLNNIAAFFASYE